jgi:phage tail-like protein
MKQEEIKGLLPEVFTRTLRPGGPLAALLGVMEAMHTPSEEALRRLHTYFDPYLAPDEFVPYLAGWVDLDLLLSAQSAALPSQAGEPPPVALSTGVGRLRELVAAAAYLSKWRGTARGLLLFLETATGAAGFSVDERVPDAHGRARPYHIKVCAPAETAPHEALIRRIIALEKPAYVTYELEFAGG